MNIKLMVQKAFIGGHWSVLIRRHDEKNYRKVKTPDGIWIADPFLYEVEGERYLFAEAFVQSKNKGVIGYFRFVDGEPVYQGVAIEQPYHMSYPCIFEYQSAYYMIPETSANMTIEMYRAEHFPDRWTLDSVLLQGGKWVDTTVRFQDAQPQLFTYRPQNGGWALEQYDLDMVNRKLNAVDEVDYRTNIGRPAGFFFGKDGNLRPAQNCGRMYGEEIIVYEVDSWQPYREHESYRIPIDQIVTKEKYNRIHTINSTGAYTAVDVRQDKFDLFHGLKTFIRVCKSR